MKTSESKQEGSVAGLALLIPKKKLQCLIIIYLFVASLSLTVGIGNVEEMAKVL